MKIVKKVTRKDMQFNEYLDVVCNIALRKGAILNITEFRNKINSIEITEESGNIKKVDVHFGNKVIPETVINPLKSDIKIIRNKEQKV